MIILRVPGPPNDNPQVIIVAGIVVGLLASCIQSLGLTIQRKSHIQNQARPEDERTSDYRRPLWVIGFAIFITSNVLGSIFQIASLPVVLLAPLGAVSLLWNAFFARMILGDIFSKFMVAGTALIVVGAVMIGIYGIVPEPTHSLDDLLLLFGRSTFLVYFSLLGVVVFAILTITHFTEWRYNRIHMVIMSPPRTPPLRPFPLTDDHGRVEATETAPLLDPKLSRSTSPVSLRSRIPTLLAISYSSMSGILSGMCLIFAKSGVELLVLTAAGHNQFNRWESWALVLGLIVFALLQLWYLHKSLVLEDPTLVCPLAFCFYNLSSIMNGLIYFDQFDRLSYRSLGLVTLGIFLLLGGVWAVSHQQVGEEGGVLEGDWSFAADVIESSVPSPVFTTFTRSDSSGYGFSQDQQTLSPSYPHRRVVSSPSIPSRAPSPALNNPPDSFPSTSGASTTPRPRAVSATHPTTTLPRGPISPPRRRSTRRATLRLSEEAVVPPIGGPPIGGFTIGLSPLSPGFALVPRQRDSSYPMTNCGTDDGATVAGENPPNRASSRLARLRAKLRWKSH
ncbi:uncharacterized protein EI90DRAFT_2973436 [Cantharellus anzutake]|uniref:uncharacterized protein n=1 Tax=Cantharellus anzutake TaxID=1750568 RepID=UPI001904A4D0|nr:uncharacterized protein EI90DRAFT_2973436 [Cantharellus anzutake]KAF8329774.1 hypothetical protein EI90DRAFT_2973436 [Cantharellus anzutake]